MNRSSPNLTAHHIQQLIKQLGNTENLLEMLYECVDRAAVTFALDLCKNNQTKAAKYLGISRTTLQKKITQLGLSKSDNNLNLLSSPPLTMQLDD